MAASTVYTASQRARAASLLEDSKTWTRGRRKADGLAFVIFPSTKPGKAWYTRTDGGACNCPSFWYRGNCAHALAVRQDYDQAQERADRRRPTYDDLMDRQLVDAF